MLISQPKIILQKQLVSREQVTCCEYIAKWNIYIIGILTSSAKYSRFEVYAFQTVPECSLSTELAEFYVCDETQDIGEVVSDEGSRSS